MISVDDEACSKIASLIDKSLVMKYRFDLKNIDYYPPENTGLRETIMYFIVMVAMDHRLSRPGREYKAVVEGRVFSGADLLYKLGSLMLRRNPGFFKPENLVHVDKKVILNWLSIGEASPPDPEVRAELLRDIGFKITRIYDGDVAGIIRPGEIDLRFGVSEGVLDKLRVFKAYMDPVEKKSHLLIKFLEARGLVRVRDYWRKRVPVDNHVTRIALRTGIVRVDSYLLNKIVSGEEVSFEEDVLIRMCVREAWHKVAVEAGVDDYALDDFLWSFGRKYCVRGKARCVESECPFRRECRAFNNGLMINEHTFYNTWFY